MPTLDLREVEPQYRHKLVLEAFNKIKAGEELVVIADHYPAHLLQLISGKIEKYNVEQKEGGVFILKVTKKAGASKENPIISHISEYRKVGDSFTPVPVLRKDEYGAIFIFLRPGQYIPIHNPNSDLILYIIQGKGKVQVEDKEYEIREGSIVIVPRGVRRGLTAETYLEGLHVVVPAPSPEDHEKVMEAARSGIKEVKL